MNELQTLIDSIKGLTDIDEDDLTEEVMQTILDGVEKQFSSELVQQSINQIVNNMED